MTDDSTFSLPLFLPYLLNQAAEAASRDLERHYRARHGMLRTEWRVLFHLGCYGDMTAKRICDLASIHKTKVSRAVAALEAKRFIAKRTDAMDRRREHLSLTDQGRKVFRALSAEAARYERTFTADLTGDELTRLKDSLTKIAGIAR